MKSIDLLERSVKTIKDRGKVYGDIKQNHTQIAKGWSVIFGVEVKPYQVALANDWQKTVRLLESPNHTDSLVDKVGYCITANECLRKDR